LSSTWAQARAPGSVDRATSEQPTDGDRDRVHGDAEGELVVDDGLRQAGVAEGELGQRIADEARVSDTASEGERALLVPLPRDHPRVEVAEREQRPGAGDHGSDGEGERPIQREAEEGGEDENGDHDPERAQPDQVAHALLGAQPLQEEPGDERGDEDAQAKHGVQAIWSSHWPRRHRVA
jgi:hypothetical protein